MSEQKDYWTGPDGDAYIKRNRGGLAERVKMWGEIIGKTRGVKSVLEFGASTGMNIDALAMMMPIETKFHAVEPNETAYRELVDGGICETVTKATINEYRGEGADFVFTRGVLIHVPPSEIEDAYHQIYVAAGKYICLAEYYAPKRERIIYRGHDNLLWKADFAGDMMDRYKNLKLVDYGFAWRRDPVFPQDDVTWFLLEKT